MLEILFAVFTLLFLYVLFRGAKRRSRFSGALGSWRIGMVAAGAAVIAVPGIIAFVRAAKTPASLYDPFAHDGRVVVPVGEAASLDRALAFLVRTVVTARGNEALPMDFVQGVIPLGSRERFTFRNGADLDLELNIDKDSKGVEQVMLHYDIRSKGSGKNGSGPLDGGHALELEKGYPACRKIAYMDNLDYAPFGSLLADRSRPAALCFLVTPLEDAEAVRRIPAREWWGLHKEGMVGVLRANLTARERSWSSSGSSSRGDFPELTGITGSGFLFITLGSLLLVFTFQSKVRGFCFLLIYLALYTGAMDSLVLRIQQPRLLEGDAENRAAAAIEVAGTRMHPVTAAGSLLDAAGSCPDLETRITAVRCLDQRRLRQALKKMDRGRDRLEALAGNEDPVLAGAAKEILVDL